MGGACSKANAEPPPADHAPEVDEDAVRSSLLNHDGLAVWHATFGVPCAAHRVMLRTYGLRAPNEPIRGSRTIGQRPAPRCRGLSVRSGARSCTRWLLLAEARHATARPRAAHECFGRGYEQRARDVKNPLPHACPGPAGRYQASRLLLNPMHKHTHKQPHKHAHARTNAHTHTTGAAASPGSALQIYQEEVPEDARATSAHSDVDTGQLSLLTGEPHAHAHSRACAYALVHG
jgi:hypothetical protein